MTQITKPDQTPIVWVVDSAYTGELHARIGVAERLGFGYKLMPLPTDNSELHQNFISHHYQQPDNQHKQLLVISGTGEETTAEIADLRKIFGKQLFNIYLASILPEERHPRLDEYDLIVSPQLSGNNTITITGVPHKLNHETLKNAEQQHSKFFSTLTQPIIAVLLGGNTRYCSGFDERHAHQIAERVVALNKKLNGVILITNSRRTPETAKKAFLNALTEMPTYFFDYQEIELSFYHAILAHASVFVVTGDSLSMCSEAAFTGKPVLVDLSKSATECFHREIIGKLIEHGAAKILSEDYQPWTYIPPDPTETVVQEILIRAKKHFNWQEPDTII